MARSRIEAGICKYTGYRRQSLECANCKYNRVVNVPNFEAAAKHERKTGGTICIYPETEYKAETASVNNSEITE